MLDRLTFLWFKDTCNLGYPSRGLQEALWNTNTVFHRKRMTGNVTSPERFIGPSRYKQWVRLQLLLSPLTKIHCCCLRLNCCIGCHCSSHSRCLWRCCLTIDDALILRTSVNTDSCGASTAGRAAVIVDAYRAAAWAATSAFSAVLAADSCPSCCFC
jgi:hypothetical protein